MAFYELVIVHVRLLGTLEYSCKASKSRVAMIQKSFCITVENVCIIEFLTGSTLVACLSIFCNVTAEKGFPFLYFLRWSNIFLVFLLECITVAQLLPTAPSCLSKSYFPTIFPLSLDFAKIASINGKSRKNLNSSARFFRTLEVNNQVVNSHLLDTTLEIDLVVHKFFRWHCPVISTPRAATTLIIIIRDLTTSKQKRSLTDY